MEIVDAKQLSRAKADGFKETLMELCKSSDIIEEVRSKRRSQAEYAYLSLSQLQCTFAIARVAVLASLFEQCTQNEKLARETWTKINAN